MRVYPDQLHRQLSPLKSCYLLLGDDPYLLDSSKRQILLPPAAKALKKGYS